MNDSPSSMVALHHAVALISRPSVTPEDGGCQAYLDTVLQPLGFVRQRLDAGGVTNSCYPRPGARLGTLAFAGHTDVVPTGPLAAWPHDPFSATVADGILHGRGAQDMKGAIACWVAAVALLLEQGVALPTLQLLITSDEEGESIDGTIRLVAWLQAHHALPDAVVVGEPSSFQHVGDIVRRGRRGVVQGKITFLGRQGHSAYPQDADNAIHRAVPVLARIAAIDWGQPASGFPATSCQITNLTAGTGAINVIPGSCTAVIDLRYNPANDYEGIVAAIAACCAEVKVDLKLEHTAQAFVTPEGPFLQLIADAIDRCAAIVTRPDTGGGTSDGRFFAAAGVPVVELGLTNGTIHQIGEQVAVAELAQLTAIYADIMHHFGVK
ncbi:MAG: succinyl-diaminopimelate desuccinylase [Mariprofundales bacterium]|nr:succinyl-diaminopimelate desuccinylase [Mariprofundales bacterium]